MISLSPSRSASEVKLSFACGAAAGPARADSPTAFAATRILGITSVYYLSADRTDVTHERKTTVSTLQNVRLPSPLRMDLSRAAYQTDRGHLRIQPDPRAILPVARKEQARFFPGQLVFVHCLPPVSEDCVQPKGECNKPSSPRNQRNALSVMTLQHWKCAAFVGS